MENTELKRKVAMNMADMYAAKCNERDQKMQELQELQLEDKGRV